MIIETPRLRLKLLGPSHLLAMFESAERFHQLFGTPLAEGLQKNFVSSEVSPVWLAMLRASTEPVPWIHGFAIIHPKENRVVGTLGFKGPPDGAGMVEIAYGVAPECQGRGYATEACAAGTDFALESEGIRLVRAHTAPTPNASTRVLTKCGFKHLGQVIDPEDGPVWRWERVQ